METNIIFSTNIDRYKGKVYKRTNVPIPRVGEMVLLSYVDRRKEFTDKGYPDSLEVMKVTYDYQLDHTDVIVELHYNSMDLKLMVAGNVEPYK